MRPRSRAFIFRHGPFSNAFRAALTALSTSALSPSATLAITSPVAGLSVSNVLPLVESTHLPSISILVCRILTGNFDIIFAPLDSPPLTERATVFLPLESVLVLLAMSETSVRIRMCETRGHFAALRSAARGP
jgi:hypothetical protein